MSALCVDYSTSLLVISRKDQQLGIMSFFLQLGFYAFE